MSGWCDWVLYHVKCLGHDTSVRQHCKSGHWAPCRNQTLSWYDWKIVESDVKPEQTTTTKISGLVQKLELNFLGLRIRDIILSYYMYCVKIMDGSFRPKATTLCMFRRIHRWGGNEPRPPPPQLYTGGQSWTNSFRIMQFFTILPETEFTPPIVAQNQNFLKIYPPTPFVKFLKFAPPFSKICLWACKILIGQRLKLTQII